MYFAQGLQFWIHRHIVGPCSSPLTVWKASVGKALGQQVSPADVSAALLTKHLWFPKENEFLVKVINVKKSVKLMVLKQKIEI